MDVQAAPDSGKATAIVSYITIIGWLIAYFVLHKKSPTALGSYHLRQTLLFHLISIAISGIVGPVLFPAGNVVHLGSIINFLLFLLWLIGFIAAVQGRKKPIPLIGKPAQSMFSTL